MMTEREKEEGKERETSLSLPLFPPTARPCFFFLFKITLFSFLLFLSPPPTEPLFPLLVPLFLPSFFLPSFRSTCGAR